ncbi:MAG TPA: phosphatase PAP2 family protein [Salinimicrobium sp.]|nr:phosphatase PAP2 family protein [Salinimicrobium sp.]
MKYDIKHAVRNIFFFFRNKFSRKNEDLAFYILIVIALVVFILGLNFFVEFTEQMQGKALTDFDRTITDFVISFRSPGRNLFFQFITDVGDLYGYLIATFLVTIFLFYKLRSWKFIFQLLAVIIVSGLSNLALKEVINRARPTIEHLVTVETLSYPSGHAMSAMSFYGFLIYLAFHIKMSRWLRGFLCVLFLFLILSIGISRIYLGVHFPSDVAGGFLAGLIWVAFCIVLFNVIYLLRKRKSSKEPVPVEENLEP